MGLCVRLSPALYFISPIFPLTLSCVRDPQNKILSGTSLPLSFSFIPTKVHLRFGILLVFNF